MKTTTKQTNLSEIWNGRDLPQFNREHLQKKKKNSWGKTECFTPKIKNKARMLTLTALIQCSILSSS